MRIIQLQAQLQLQAQEIAALRKERAKPPPANMQLQVLLQFMELIMKTISTSNPVLLTQFQSMKHHILGTTAIAAHDHSSSTSNPLSNDQSPQQQEL